MFVYANLLGTWTELTDNDKIDGSIPVNFVNEVLFNYENPCINHDFFEVEVKNTKYYIHKSCIQCTVSH